jgi:large subunit ribosomal protein L3
MGTDTVTQAGLKIVKIDAERNLLLIDGSVPGPNGANVTVNKVKK